MVSRRARPATSTSRPARGRSRCWRPRAACGGRRTPPSGRAGAGWRAVRGRGRRGWPVLAAAQLHAGPVGRAVMPGRLDQQPAGVPVAGLGDRPLRAGPTGGGLGGHQTRGRRRSSGRSTGASPRSRPPTRTRSTSTTPRRQPSRVTTGVNSLAAAIAVIAASSRSRRPPWPAACRRRCRRPTPARARRTPRCGAGRAATDRGSRSMACRRSRRSPGPRRQRHRAEPPRPHLTLLLVTR